MALSTDFNVDPYYDDYSESKEFYRVLFRPGYAVQAREVTQLQTILQKQIERNGRYFFEEGSVVLGCELNYDDDIKSVKLENQFAGSDLTISNFSNAIITGATSNARGRVVATAASTSADQPTLMFHYMNNNEFDDGETIQVEGSTTQANTISVTGASGLSDAVSNGAVISINSGVFYVGGYFVFKGAESLILEKYNNTPSYRIGLQVTESIVTPDADTSLLDPAQGAYNYAAQGANRYKINLALSAKSINSTDPVEAVADEGFYQFLKLENGKRIQETKYPVYTELDKTLARRTYDESGDYTIKPFNIKITDHQGIKGRTAASGEASTLSGVGTNFTEEFSDGDIIYLSGNSSNTAKIANTANNTTATLTRVSGTGAVQLGVATANQVIHFESKFSAGLDPGKAYVKGYEYESLGTKYVTVDKGRDQSTVNAYSLNTSIGNKLYVKNANGRFDISKHDIISFYSGNTATQNVSGVGSTQFSNRNSQTKIGTARVRDMDWYSSSGNTANVSHSHSDYVLYLYDIRTSNNKTGVVTDVPRKENYNLTGSGVHPSLRPTYPIRDRLAVKDASSNTTTKTFEIDRQWVTIGNRKLGNTASNNYMTGGTSNDDNFDKLAPENDEYNGAKVTITVPDVRFFQGEDNTQTPSTDGPAPTANAIYNIALEHKDFTSSDDYDKSSGRLVLEAHEGATGSAGANLASTIVTNTFTRTIESYQNLGDIISITLDEELPKPAVFVANSTGGANSSGHGSGASAEQVLCSTFDIQFQAKDAKSIASTNSSHRFASADIDELSKYNNLPTGKVVLGDTQLNSLVFPLPKSPVYHANNITFTYKKTQTVSSSGTDGTTTISLSGSDKFPVSGTLSPTVAQEYFIVVSNTANHATGEYTTGVKLQKGQYVPLAGQDGVTRPVVISGGDQTATISMNTGSVASQSYDVTYTVKREDVAGNLRVKTIEKGNTTYSTGSVGTPANIDSLNNQVANGQYVVTAPTKEIGTKIELPVSDAFNLVKVVDSGSTAAKVTTAMLSATANNITDRYELHTGQTDSYYGHSSIALKPGKYPPAGQIMVIYDYFKHQGAGYLTANSYPSSGTWDGESKTFDFASIPSFTSPTTGETYRLSDVLDFRPVVLTNEGTASGGAVATSYDIAGDTAAVDATSILIPDSDTTTTLDYSYYLPRIDKLVLTRDRQFEVIKGKPDTNPVAPPDDEDSMTLYTLKIPAYTFALTDIETRYIDNKRFTMRDIGKLEKRIERLEYYTSLTILERETEGRDITSEGSKDSLFNATGNRFKSGILVDPFAGHSIGDVTREEFNSAVHFKDKQMRPAFFADNFKFKFNSETSNNITKTGDLVTLPYTSATLVDQPMSSGTASINPFNIVNFIGSLKLDPASDTWFDDTTRPDVSVNLEGHHDNWTISPDSTRKGFGLQWDDWSTLWSGKQVNPEPKSAVSQEGSSATRSRSTQLVSQNRNKFGIQSDNPVETIVKTVGNKVVDSSVIHYVREQTLSFAAKGLKPLSNVYVFLGSTDMSANTEPAKKLVLGSANGMFKEGETVKDTANNRGIVRIASNTVSNVATIFITDINGNTSATGSSPVTSVLNRTDSSSIGFATSNVITGLSSGANGVISTPTANSRGILSSGISQMQTNDQGEVAGDISIPAGKFRTGDQLIRILDHANNELDSTSTVAESFYKVKGVLQNREKLIISTREPIVRRDTISDESVTIDTTTRQTPTSKFLNPMAQSLIIDPVSYPMGVFLKDVTVWFSKKDVNLPITLQVRPMFNGVPSSSLILPFSEITLNPDVVQVSATANASSSNTTTSTTFTFESPVYLTPDEYALVFISNSPEYELFTASYGDNATGTTRKISKQPFVGSFFRPQNAGAWEPKKEEFLMMRINRCDFTGTGGTTNYAIFENLKDSATGNTANVKFETFKVTGSTIQFSNTKSSFVYSSRNTSDSAMADGEFDIDQNITLANTRQITAGSSPKPEGQFSVNCIMSTANGHVSPVIDIDRLSLITVENDVDNAGIALADITVTSSGGGYVNTTPNATTATISAPDLSDGVTATANVHVEVVLPVKTDATVPIFSSNTDYTVASVTPGKFVIGEGVRTVANNSSNTSGTSGGTAQGITSGAGEGAGVAAVAYGIITDQTYVDDDPTKNVASITIKTNAKSKGVFVNSCFVLADGVSKSGGGDGAQADGYTATGLTSSNTFISVGTVTGSVSNVVPWASGGTTVETNGSGYLTTPTVTITGQHDSSQSIATATIRGEDQTSGGNINTKYITRRVTLEDGFDASDLKVIVNAYKPIGTGIHIYYKVRADSDPEDFDNKKYVLMTQETVSSQYSGDYNDIKEYVFKTTDDKVEYTSENTLYDKFKTFSIKIVLTAESNAEVPRLTDLRAIALDT